ncbi:MAG: hypothetical protein HOV80_05270 [Polyangiaceae bacterium]|nr:hypothetical protein [Polyangiaceae bacterium]
MKEDAKSRRRSADGVPVSPAARRSSRQERTAQERAQHVISFVADEMAMAALSPLTKKEEPSEQHCDACDARIEGEPGGKGLFYWFRGEEVRFDEPPLCDDCAAAITHAANRAWDIEEEEG